MKLEGRAGDMIHAFEIKLDRYEHEGHQYRARTGDIKLPPELAPSVEAVRDWTTGRRRRRTFGCFLHAAFLQCLVPPGTGPGTLHLQTAKNQRRIRRMSKLNAAKRKSLPTSEFALPGERKYPVENASHAANAKARATQAVKAGKMSSATKSKIDRKAAAVLGKGHKQVKKPQAGS